MDFSEIKELKFIFPKKKFCYFLTKLKTELWLMPGNVNSQKFPHGNLRSSMATSGPRRGPTFNNRWWNDRREWNLRIRHRERGSVPKGGEPHPVLPLFAPFGDDWRVCISYPQVPWPSVIPPAVIHIRPLWGRRMPDRFPTPKALHYPPIPLLFLLFERKSQKF